jgi:hypothetical protein
MDSKTARIRALNDELRQNFAGGAAVMTPGIAALGGEAVARIVKTIAVFDDFCHANDPHEEHDFGAFDADGHRPREQFRVLYLDKRNNLIADEVLAEGTVDHTPVYPREVLRRGIELHATGCVLVHNCGFR